MPQDPIEIQEAVKAMIEHEGPVYMRIGNPKIPQIFERKPFEIGKGTILKEGNDVTIISTGSTTKSVLEALPLLEEKGISAQVIGMPTVFPLDKNLVRNSALKTGKVVTVEEHYVDGGLGSIVVDELCEMANVTVKRIGMPMGYAKTRGNYEELLAYYKLDAAGITESVCRYLNI